MRALAPLIAAAAVFALALAPIPALPLGDKALHLIAFALIAWLAVRAGWNAFVVAGALCVFAAAIEIAQAAWAPDRAASVIDAAVSMLGAGLGVAIAHVHGWRALAAGVAACLAVGVGLDLAVNAARPALTQALIAQAWRDGAAAHQAGAPWPGAPARIALRIEVEGREIFVADSSEQRALAMAPGLWPGRRPGDAGTTIVLGHRNAAFQVLGRVAEHDVIAVETVSGVGRLYRVVSRDVVRWNASGLYPETSNEVLALVTCWPIGESTPTPWRLIVRAEPLASLAERR